MIFFKYFTKHFKVVSTLKKVIINFKFAQELSEYSSELNVKFADVDITNAHALSGRFLITALPTIFHCSEGVCRKFKGKRDVDTLYSYLADERILVTFPIIVAIFVHF